MGENLVRASSGREALKCVLDQEFAVILLDVHMPELNGLETAQAIRSREKTRHLPIIFVTGIEKNLGDVVRGYSVGAVDYIIKPVVPEILKSKIEVFVSLYRKTAELAQQYREREKEKEREREREREIEELKETLSQHQALTGWEGNSVTAQMAGVGPLRDRAPEMMAVLQTKYESLLDAYLEALAFNQTPPREEIAAIANGIGGQGGGPRDVVDLHLRSISTKSEGVPAKRARAYALEGRLLALEVMGNLADYYRMRRTKFVEQKKENT